MMLASKMLCLTACLGFCSSATAVPENGECEDRLLVVMGNSTSSITVQVGSTQTGNATSYVADIHGCHVSYECSRNPGSCTSVRVGPDYVAVPANGSVAFVRSSEEFFVEHFSDGVECDPTEIYYSPQAGFIWLVCRERDGSIWLLAYGVRLDSGMPVRHGEVIRSQVISSGGGNNKPYQVFVDHHCTTASMFVLINQTIRHYDAPSSFVEGPKLENCTDINYVTLLGDTVLVVQCSEGTTAMYDVCRGRWAYFYPDDRGLYIPCGPSLGVRYDRDVIQVVNSSSTGLQSYNHSLGEIAQVRCNEHLLYVRSTSGVESIIPLEELGNDEFPPSVKNSCSGPLCSAPFLDTNGLVVLNEERNKIRVYSTSSQCRHSLVLEERINSIRNGIYLPISLSSSSRHFCPCPPPTPTVESATPHKPTTEELVTLEPRINRSSSLKVGLSVGLPIFILFVVVCVGVICLSLYYTGSCKTVKQKFSGRLICQERENFSEGEMQPCTVEDTARGGASVSTGRNCPHSSITIHPEDVERNINGRTEQEKNDRTLKVNHLQNGSHQ